MVVWAIILASWFSWANPTPAPTPLPIVGPIVIPVMPAPAPPLLLPPEIPALSPAGETLIIEFEVGGRSGYNPHPELPDLRYSGITIGIGFDLHQNSPAAITADWAPLPVPEPTRLAATHPFYGQSAVEPWHRVQDIMISWQVAIGVFDKIDVAREWARAKRAMPGFEDLRANSQAAIISLIFNRGASMVGDHRKEMRTIRDLVPKKDYSGMAAEFKKMVRVWSGTPIYKGMKRRRLAEAKLMELP